MVTDTQVGKITVTLAKDAIGKYQFDAQGFGKDLKDARDQTKPTAQEAEAHLGRIQNWTTALGVGGVVLAVRGSVSPLAMLTLGYHKYAKFAILAHHSLHGGFGRERRGWFARGLYRRAIDWLDWILPEAWNIEHNKIHHYRLNEDADPDFVQNNLEEVRNYPLPMFVKYGMVLWFMGTWKWVYYASNTLKLLHEKQSKPNAPPTEVLQVQHHLGRVLQKGVTPSRWWSWYRSLLADLIVRSLAPPLLLNFVLLPVVSGLWRWTKSPIPFCCVTLLNLLGAEIVNNVVGFVTIVTNHAGEDLWWFKDPCRADTPEFYLRAILGSTAYPAGSDLVDYLHGYLNYQGEHHSFPDLSPLHYQRLHPLFKNVCAKYGVPYVQESTWTRLRKTVDVMLGFGKHKRLYGQAVDQPEMWQVEKDNNLLVRC